MLSIVGCTIFGTTKKEDSVQKEEFNRPLDKAGTLEEYSLWVEVNKK